jgi:Sec-independent protein translocase protein TatA
MEILGIGPMELAFILLLAIIIFGPKDIVKASKTIGQALNKFVRSDTWKTINQTSQELKNLPTRLMREAGLEDLEKAAKNQLNETDHSIRQSVASNPAPRTIPGGTNLPAGATEPPKNEPPENKGND